MGYPSIWQMFGSPYLRCSVLDLLLVTEGAVGVICWYTNAPRFDPNKISGLGNLEPATKPLMDSLRDPKRHGI